jgi:pSer/pThr/pTyr-binding forkhead associated (FHA) protein
MNDQDFSSTEMIEEKEINFGDKNQAADVEGEGDVENTEIEESLTEKATIVIKKDNEIMWEHTLETLPAKIGRKSDCQIVLEERNVSRNHAQIVLKEDQYYIEDLRSTKGTILNGEKVEEKDLHTGDIIEIGDYKLHFNSGNPEDERTILDTDEETILEDGTELDEDRTLFYEEPEAKLVIIKSDTLEDEIIIETDEIILGRDETVDVTIDDKRLSREHCKIFMEDNNHVISDLGSSNGTFVNGQKITTQHVLENGDRIQVGSNILEFCVERPGIVQKKTHKGLAAKTAFVVVALAVLGLIAYKMWPILKPPALQKVIMQTLWEYDTKSAVSVTPAVGDLNGDGFINVVAADMGGSVYALDGRQGGISWNSEFRKAGGSILSAPLLIDINKKDGELDVIIGTSAKGVLAIDGSTARQIWSGKIKEQVTSPPAAADINSDGTSDVFVGTFSGEVICLDGRQGGIVWKFDTGAIINTAPVMTDLNSDGVSDVIIGAENYKLYAFDGKTGDRIWVNVGTEEPSTVACGKFNRDKTLDVAVVYPTKLVLLDGKSGAKIWQWNIPMSARPTSKDPFRSIPPAITDLNQDKIPDVILSTSGGHVYAVDGASMGERYLWDFGLTPSKKTEPALCDFNKDGIADVVVGDNKSNLIIIDGKTGYQLNRIKLNGAIVSSPVIGDFTSDGFVDLVVGTRNNKIITIQTETKVKKNQIIWDSFGGNSMNMGFYTF